MSEFSGRPDLHLHTTVSDGTDTPQALLEKIRSEGITVFSFTDHDAVKAAEDILPLLTRDDPLFIPGVEFSCRDDAGKYHILGYGFDPQSKAILSLVGHAHRIRIEKARRRIDAIRTQFGFAFPQEEIDRLFASDNPGKPHIANLMIRHGYARSIPDAIDNHLNKIPVHSERIPPQDAIEAILSGGGVPVLAHPLFGSGSDRLDEEQMASRLQRLLPYGLQGAEAFYSGFSGAQRALMLSLADRFDLLVTAGSDYHGKNKTVKLGDTGLDASEMPERLRRFLEKVGAVR